MNRYFYFLLPVVMLLLSFTALGQQVEFEEYDLDNGLHVILHKDSSAPVVITSVMYHVGGKDRGNGKTGFAHFFEHLLFEGSKNIETGTWFKIVTSNGGILNAWTSNDQTYYYEVFPSNQLKLGLWMESERMLHPVIDQKGVDTQNEVVKEERRSRYDNAPYGQILHRVMENVFTEHPYKDPNIGYMADLDAAQLEEFLEYNDKYYVPNNAVLVIAGDINIAESKKLIVDYFGTIPRGEDVTRNYPREEPISNTINVEAYDPNIQIPAGIMAYRMPGTKERDAYVLDMISSYLSDGKSSKLYKKMVDDQKQALQVASFYLGQEDYGVYFIYALPVGETSLDTLFEEMEEEVAKIREELISERDYQKLQNIFENKFVNANSSIQGIAGSLATYYLIYGNTNLINDEIEIYQSITREEIMEVARKYLNPNQRLELKYLPKEPVQN